MSHFATAKTLCVNPAGSSGCSTTIGAAVTAAAAGDQITVAAGQYGESVVITKPLSLVGAGPDSTIINARGLPNGIYVNGLDNGGLNNVLVTGFTIVNANYEGILLTNTSNSLVANNHVSNNDQNLNYAAASCPGLPIFETNEAEDCGEGIHLVGAFAVTVSNNVVDLNAGGILVTDETGPSFENLITSNSVHDNALDCGITMASHAPSPQATSKLPYGVFNNNIVGNNSSSNGRVGFGAGIGIFAPGPGNLAYGNKVINNVVTNNGIPGITIHNHAAPPAAPPANLNDNVIMGNFVSGNGADGEDAATPGTTGINVYSVTAVYATQILQNTIQNQQIGVVINHPGGAAVHLNNFPVGAIGIANLGKATVDGTMNFYGCASGPGAPDCATIKGDGVISAPWLPMPTGSKLEPKGRP